MLNRVLCLFAIMCVVRVFSADVTELLLLGSSEEIVGKIDRIGIRATDREGVDTCLKENKATPFVLVSDKQVIKKIIIKARSASEQSAGKIAAGRYLVVLVIMGDGSRARFVVMDNDSVVLVKESGDLGASYPSPGVFDFFSVALKDRVNVPVPFP